jgi:hypothetical protein
MSHQEQRTIGTGRRKQFTGVLRLKLAAKSFMDNRLDAETSTGEPGSVQRAHARASERVLEDDSDLTERAPSRPRLPLPPVGKTALEVWAHAVIFGVAVPQ